MGTLQSSRTFSSFTQSPSCEADLTYTVLDSAGDELDPDLEVQVLSSASQNLLLVATQKASLIGTYQL